jgi:thiosulfate dehydrogenase [quinone] large subunit
MNRAMKSFSTKLPDLTSGQWTTLIMVRVLIGWHLTYEGAVKLIDPDWSAAAYLQQSTWIFASMFQTLAENPFILMLVDIVNQWGLLFIGVALIAGLFTRAAGMAGFIFLLMYYLANPPLFSQESLLIAVENAIIVNKLLIEAVALLAVSMFPTGRVIGIDYLITKYSKKDKNE